MRTSKYINNLIGDLEKMQVAGVSDRLSWLAVNEFLETGKIPPTPRVLRNVKQWAGKSTTSQYFGVHHLKKGRFRWQARITRKECKWNGGNFVTEIEAHEAVEEQLDKMHVQKQ